MTLIELNEAAIGAIAGARMGKSSGSHTSVETAEEQRAKSPENHVADVSEMVGNALDMGYGKLKVNKLKSNEENLIIKMFNNTKLDQMTLNGRVVSAMRAAVEKKMFGKNNINFETMKANLNTK